MITFGESGDSKNLDLLIDENLIVTHEIVLTELLPYLKIKKQTKVIALWYEINKIQLDINWKEIIEFQVKCLESSAKGIGTPDLIIAQNAKQNGSKVCSLDKHFRLLNKVLNIDLYK